MANAAEIDVVGLHEKSHFRFRKKPSFFGMLEINNRIKQIWAELDIKKNDDCLDFGCGGGWLSVAMALAGANVTALDINPEYIEKRVLPLAKENKVKLDTIVFDGSKKFPFKKKFDWIVAIESIEHLENPKETIDGFRDFLKENGRILLTFPNKDLFFWKLVLFLQKLKIYRPNLDVAGRDIHKEFSKKAAFRLVEGFKILKYKKTFSSHLFLLSKE